MLDRVDGRDKREGAVIWDSNASSAIELKNIYLALDDLLVEAFGDSASREFLIRRAKERFIIPFPATHAIFRGEFTPSDIDVSGRRFLMPNTALTYIVEDFISPGGVYKVRCEQSGNEGNRFLGNIIPMGGAVPRLQTAVLTELLIPARDEESTESIRQRYFDSFNERAFGGNIRDYQVNTRSVDGVGAVKVTPVWNGGGTVLITILDVLFNPASAVLIDRVQEVLDPTGDHMGVGLAPIGHVVTVRTADIVTVDVSTELTLAGGFTIDMVREQVTAAIDGYLLELREDWENQDVLTPIGFFQNPLFVVISQINSRVLNIHGVIDIQNTTINASTSNLEVEKYSVPMLGVINI